MRGGRRWERRGMAGRTSSGTESRDLRVNAQASPRQRRDKQPANSMSLSVRGMSLDAHRVGPRRRKTVLVPIMVVHPKPQLSRSAIPFLALTIPAFSSPPPPCLQPLQIHPHIYSLPFPAPPLPTQPSTAISAPAPDLPTAHAPLPVGGTPAQTSSRPSPTDPEGWEPATALVLRSIHWDINWGPRITQRYAASCSWMSACRSRERVWRVRGVLREAAKAGRVLGTRLEERCI